VAESEGEVGAHWDQCRVGDPASMEKKKMDRASPNLDTERGDLVGDGLRGEKPYHKDPNLNVTRKSRGKGRVSAIFISKGGVTSYCQWLIRSI